MNIQAPGELVGERCRMYEAFVRFAALFKDNESYALEIYKLLPQSLKEAPVWFDKMTQMWRYQYGAPLTNLSQNMLVYGTTMQLPVSNLYKALKVADKRLSRTQLLKFLEQLSDTNKHCDFLFEMRPLINVSPNLKASYDVAGLGIGNTTCDWQIKGRTLNIIFDVKNRIKSLIEHMKQITPSLDKGLTQIRPTAPNPEDLFKSVEKKLQEKCYLKQLQGVWIHSHIKEDEKKLMSYFKNNLNKQKVHFAILSDWNDDALILTRNIFVRLFLKKKFHLTESTRFLSNEYN